MNSTDVWTTLVVAVLVVTSTASAVAAPGTPAAGDGTAPSNSSQPTQAPPTPNNTSGPAVETPNNTSGPVTPSAPADSDREVTTEARVTSKQLDDDQFEPNDFESSAADISKGDSYSGLTVTAGDVDYYAIDLSGGETIESSISFDSSDANLDLELLDPSGLPVESSTTITDDESLSHEATTDGTYYLKVTSAFDGTAEYDLSAGTEQTGDQFESNDFQSTATDVSPGESYSGLSITDGDRDYFELDANAGQTIESSISFEHSEGDLDLKLLADDGSVVARSETTTDDETISHEVSESGSYYIFVYPPVGGTASYDLSVGQSGDRLEPNDIERTATNVSWGDSYSGLTIDEGDVDYFAVEVDEGEVIEPTITFSNDEVDLDMELYAPDGSFPASSATDTDDESISHEAEQSGTYYVRVVPYSGAPGPYDFSIGTGDGGGGGPSDIGDTPAAAREVAQGDRLEDVPFTGRDDQDYFAVEADEGERITTKITFDHGEANLDLVALAPNESSVTSSFSFSDNETVSHVATQSGTYYVKVDYQIHKGPARPGTVETTYDIDFSNVSIGGGGDQLEDNDERETATAVSSGDSYDGLSVSSDDVDYFAVDVTVGERIDPAVALDDGGQNLEVSLLDSDGTEIASRSVTDGDDSINHTVRQSGTYYLRVDTTASARTTYDFELDVFGVADRLEDNDRTATATDAGAGDQYEELTVRRGDADYFAVNMSAGETIAPDLYADGDGVKLELLDPSGSRIRNGGDINYKAQTSGTYYVKVTTTADRPVVYMLQLEVIRDGDRLEDNDRLGTATPVQPGETYAGLTLVEGDTDFFAVDVRPDTRIRTTTTVRDGDASIEAALLAPNGTVLTTAANDAPTKLTYRTTAGGTYYVRLTTEGDGAASYFTETTLRGGTDSLDPDDSPATATPLSLGDRYDDLLATGDDPDYFAFNVSAGDQIDPRLSVHRGSEVAHMELRAPDGTTVADSNAHFSGDDGSLEHVAAQSGTYHLRVDTFGELRTEYNISYGRTTGDRLEPDGWTTRATPVEPGDSYANLSVGPEDEDYFSFNVSAGDPVDPRIRAHGDLDGALLAPDGSTVSDATWQPTEEHLRYEAAESGTYYLRLSTEDRVATEYRLTYANSTGDRLEPDDHPARATTVALGDDYENLTVVRQDPDYFAFNVSAGDRIDPEISASDDTADVSLGLTDSDGDRITGRQLYDGDASLDHTVRNGGTYYLRVESDRRDPVSYSLRYGNASGDRLEPDDWWSRATPVSFGDRYGNLTVSREDPDYFAFNVTAGDRIDPSVTAQSGHLDQRLVGPDGTRVADTDLSSSDSIDHEAQMSGTYYLRVASDSREPVAYEFVYGDSTGDRFEPDDHPSRATPVALGDSYENLTAAGDDPDYFAFNVSAGDRIDPSVTAQSRDLEKRLIGPDGDRVADTGYYGADPTDYEARKSGTYYLRIATESRDQVAYALDYGNETGDRLEPDDYRSRATPVELVDRYDNLTVERDDPDYFAFTVTEGDRIDPTVTAQSDTIDQRLIGPDGDPVAETRDFGARSIDYEAEQSGTYYLRVSSDSRDRVSYDLSYGDGTGDRLEPDDYRSRATPVELGESYENLTVESGDPDYFAFNVTEGGRIDPSVTAPSRAIDQQLVGPDGDRVAETRDYGARTIDYEARESGTYYLRLSSDGRDPVAYNLSYGNTTGDRLEPNDYRSRATPVAPGDSYENLTVESGDSDYFAFTVSEGVRIDPTVTASSRAIDKELLGPDGDRVAGWSYYGSDSIDHEARESGTYYLRVSADGRDPVAYNLSYGNTSGDRLEPDDYRSRATPVEPGDSYENLTVEREDPDYFAFTVSEGDRIDPTVTAQSYGLDQRLLGPDGDRVAGTGFYGADSIDYEARESGTYYLAVTTDSYAAIRYNITYGG